MEPVPFDLTNGATGKDEEENLEEAETSLLATPPEAIEGEEAGHGQCLDASLHTLFLLLILHYTSLAKGVHFSISRSFPLTRLSIPVSLSSLHCHLFLLPFSFSEEKMDTVFEEPASPTNSSAPLLTAEAAEGEGVVRSRTQPNNNWGPILYNHKFHPLQIMVSGL